MRRLSGGRQLGPPVGPRPRLLELRGQAQERSLAGRAPGELHDRVRRQLDEGGVPAQAAADLAVFLLSPEARGISGKLISAQWDDWRDGEFRARLVGDPDFATLRRIDDQKYRRVR